MPKFSENTANCCPLDQKLSEYLSRSKINFSELTPRKVWRSQMRTYISNSGLKRKKNLEERAHWEFIVVFFICRRRLICFCGLQGYNLTRAINDDVSINARTVNVIWIPHFIDHLYHCQYPTRRAVVEFLFVIRKIVGATEQCTQVITVIINERSSLQAIVGLYAIV